MLKGLLSEVRRAEGKEKEIEENSKSKVATNMYVSIITLNVNSLNAPKRYRVAEWIKNKAYIYTHTLTDILPPRDPLYTERYIHTKSKGM